jgi:hypothetical protein
MSRYLRCIHITKQPFRVHSCTNNDDDTTTTLHTNQTSIKPDQTSTHYHVMSEQREHSENVEVDSFDSGHSVVVGLCEFSNEASHPTT